MATRKPQGIEHNSAPEHLAVRGSGSKSPAPATGGAGDGTSTAAEAIYDAIIAGMDAGGDPALADALELLARRKEQNRFLHAAAVLRGKKGGRPAINDDAVLRRIRSCPEAQRKDAVGKEARKLAGPEASKTKVATIARRLRDKLQNNKAEEMDFLRVGQA